VLQKSKREPVEPTCNFVKIPSLVSMPHARNVAVSLGKWPARNNSLRQQVLKLKKSAFHGRAWARPKLLGMASRISRSLHILYASIRNVHTRLSDPEERLRARAHCFFFARRATVKSVVPTGWRKPNQSRGVVRNQSPSTSDKETEWNAASACAKRHGAMRIWGLRSKHRRGWRGGGRWGAALRIQLGWSLPEEDSEKMANAQDVFNTNRADGHNT